MKSIKTVLLGVTLSAGAAVFVGTTDASADELYTIQAGDTLSTISNQFVGDNSLIQQIADKNNISDINLIYAGEKITIPTDGVAATEVTSEPVSEPATDTPVETYEEPTTYVEETYTEPAVAETTTTAATTSSAKEWIAQKESGGSYSATNGRYIGRYQLDSAYLNGDYSAANQEQVADNYVAERYGSWEAAQAFWVANGWY
ncbi:LysM peptidoglycan-binding domain-containing protein [Enterococcus asini]|uniref:aggregation-promoting factor n=1 Tax=Enterococcus asini TaxID=57732 RepID=UPI0028924D27|nr:LysM peptidoglycan-binding domain-containing protein [Enterococcus asini]MDT2763873.1 LysM peptidoglycan-binding domain-containing protein [Enterococcus asini]